MTTRDLPTILLASSALTWCSKLIHCLCSWSSMAIQWVAWSCVRTMLNSRKQRQRCTHCSHSAFSNVRDSSCCGGMLRSITMAKRMRSALRWQFFLHNLEGRKEVGKLTSPWLGIWTCSMWSIDQQTRDSGQTPNQSWGAVKVFLPTFSKTATSTHYYHASTTGKTCKFGHVCTLIYFQWEIFCKPFLDNQATFWHDCVVYFVLLIEL
jgi:hypothetical protein